MKNTFLITALLLAGMAMAQNEFSYVATQSPLQQNAPAAKFNWEYTAYSFGKIPQGKPVTITYNFTNTGDAPLIITAANPSCGCTGAKFTQEAIAPGKKGFVSVTFNAAAAGNFSKSVSVMSNVDANPIILTFNGEVVPETVSPVSTGN